MFNIEHNANNTFDQNRIYIAAQTGFKKLFSLEVGYINAYQHTLNGF